MPDDRPYLTDEEFAEIEKIAQLATPPPQEAIGQEIHASDGVVGQTGKLVGATGFGVRFDLEMRANAQLYAAVHRLLGDARYWRAEAKRLRGKPRLKVVRLETEDRRVGPHDGGASDD